MLGIAQEMTFPPLLMLAFDLGVDAVLIDWEIELRKSNQPDGESGKTVITPDNWRAMLHG